MKMSSTSAVALALGFILMSFTGQCYSQLQVGFYEGKCKFIDVETTVSSIVKQNFLKDPTIAAALIRMQFHDCFVKGCDASILLDGSSSEKTAPPNLSLRGFDVIDAVKSIVERFCPGVVSCADIISLATRDVIFLSGGGRYDVPTGRRDGFESLAQNVDLPSPTISVSDSIAKFAGKGLRATDMVYLLGVPKTQQATILLNLDQNPLSSFIVDKSYYGQILAHRGILQIDQELALDPLTQATVTTIANGYDFNTKFGQAMVKLGAVQVLTGTQGEIRKSCRAINKPFSYVTINGNH
uniref:Peroxidase n=1 Tax=Fagus sylvatica TaxID=28930 RepID=A0A2N9ISN9_FAGSY